MNLLIIGDAFSQYTIAFSRFLKLYDSTIKIDIINTRLVDSNKVSSEKFVNVYDKMYRNGFLNKFILRIPKLRGLIVRLAQKKTVNEVNRVINEYDVICIHGFWKEALNVYNKLDASHTFTVGAVWGSDFYRRKKGDDSLFKAFDRCDRVLVATDEMENDILAVYPLSPKKIRKCMFGLEPLETLFKMSGTSVPLNKKMFGFEEKAFVITCGHNASQFQEHLKIIDQLIENQLELPPSYILVFPVTYGGSKNYILKIKDKLQKSGLKHKLIEEYLTDEKIALLRLATDIFIQVQKTDAFSGSMREHLFAQNIVITGDWLPYQSLSNEGIYFKTISDLNQLGGMVTNVIKNYEEFKQIVKDRNIPDKFQHFRWPVSIIEWHRVFLEYKYAKHE